MQELIHCVDALLAGRTPRDGHTLSALRDRWRSIHEVREIVPKNFLL
jgi:hypothetical protein